MADFPEAPPPGVPAHAFTPRERRRAIAAATLGNGLEFYDFITFAFFAIQIGHTFFPSQSSFLSLMASLATFGVGFVTRPLGAHVLGGYADRHGRKPAMLLSMSLMGTGIVLLALTPGYASIGIAAPIIAVLARLMQGFALGGEVGSATVYMLESAPDHRRGLAISWQSASQSVAASIGALVGLLLSGLMSEAELASYGWRIALLLGTSIVPLALWIRNSLPETIHHAETGPALPPSGSLRPHLRPILLGAIIIMSGTIATYIFQYMATYGQDTLHLSFRLSLTGEFANNAIQVATALAGGLLSDLYGRRRLMIVPQAAFCLLIAPCFWWLTLQRDATSFIGANLLLAGVNGLVYGGVYASISESIPKAFRARAFALVYALPVAAFGGTTQLVVTWLLRATGEPMSIAWYLTAISVAGLGAMLAMRESAPVRLAHAAGESEPSRNPPVAATAAQ